MPVHMFVCLQDYANTTGWILMKEIGKWVLLQLRSESSIFETDLDHARIQKVSKFRISYLLNIICLVGGMSPLSALYSGSVSLGKPLVDPGRFQGIRAP